jgi:hypothetical protein
MAKRRKIDKIVIDNKMFMDCDWRAFVVCVDEEGDYWELRAISADNPTKALENALEAFNEEDWTNYGYTVKKQDSNEQA